MPKLHDRAYIQIGLKSVGVLYRGGKNNLKINSPNNTNTSLFIIVENMGRLNYGDDLLDNKGILNGVKLDGKTLLKWTICLTSNFIPYYQEMIQSELSENNDKKRFVDLIAKYKNPDRLFLTKNFKYD